MDIGRFKSTLDLSTLYLNEFNTEIFSGNYDYWNNRNIYTSRRCLHVIYLQRFFCFHSLQILPPNHGVCGRYKTVY